MEHRSSPHQKDELGNNVILSSAHSLPSLPLIRSAVPTSAEVHGDDAAITDLTSRLAAGDESAFRQFHASYFDRLYVFLLVLCRGNEDQTQEALQQTMLRVARYARPFTSEEVFWSWLKVLARSTARDAGRQRKRYADLIERFSLFRKHQAGPESASEEPDLQQLLREILHELPLQDQQTLEAKYLVGETVREISTRLGVTEKAVEGRLSRLRRLLRDRLIEKLKSL